MRVEKVGSDAIKEKLDALKKRKLELEVNPVTRPSAKDEFDTKISSQIYEEELKKQRRKEEVARKAKEREALEAETIDPEICELMGFGGFGGSGKKR